MEYKCFGDTYVVRIDRGEEIIEKLTELCKKEKIRLGSIEGLAAADHIVMGAYSVSEKVFHKTELNEEMEVSSLTGNISEKDGEVYLHLHINAAGKDGITHGGHLNEARISATCEIFVRKINGVVERKPDPVTGLNLYEF